MAFEGVLIHSTRDGAHPDDDDRYDLAINEVIVLSLTSMVGVSSVKWELVGVPEGSAAGGGGPEPIDLGTSPTASFTVDNDTVVPLDGTYVVRATINPGSPGETRLQTILCRMTALTIPGPAGTLPLRMLGPFEALEDKADVTVRQGYAKMLNRWLRYLRTLVLGAGVPTTLAGAYSIGSSAADQRPIILDSKGGLVEFKADGGGFTGAIAVQITTKLGGPIVFESNGRVGIGTTTPAVPLEIAAAAPSMRFNSSGVDFDIVDDGTDLAVKVGATTIAIFRSAGGVQAAGGFGANTLPPGGAAFAVADRAATAVAAANTARYGYNDTLKRPEYSVDGGAWRPFASVINADGIATGTVQLASVSILGLDRTTIAWVESVGDFFRLDPTSTVTADGITVVTAAGGTGRWLRMNVPNPKWHAVTTWYYDPANAGAAASDENAGTSDTAPLRTFHEWARRMGGARVSAARVLRILSDETDTTAGNFDVCQVLPGGYFELRGASVGNAYPTVVRSGTLTSGTVAASGNTPGIIEDTALTTSWTDANGSGLNLVSNSTNGTLLIRVAGGNVRGFIIRSFGKTGRVLLPSSTSEDVTTAISGASAAFASGNAYEVLRLRRFPGITSNHNVPNAVRGIFLDLGVGSTTVRIQGSSIQLQLCGVRNFSSIHPTLGFNFYQCVFTSTTGNNWSGNGIVPRFCTWAGNGTAVGLQLTGGGGDWNSTFNAFDQCGLDVQHRTGLDHAGTLSFYDLGAGQQMINVDNQAHVSIDAINGSGNAGPILNVNRSQTGATLLPASATVVTSHATPYVVIGTAYTAAEFNAAPLTKLAAAAGIYRP